MHRTRYAGMYCVRRCPTTLFSPRPLVGVALCGTVQLMSVAPAETKVTHFITRPMSYTPWRFCCHLRVI